MDDEDQREALKACIPVIIAALIFIFASIHKARADEPPWWSDEYSTRIYYDHTGLSGDRWGFNWLIIYAAQSWSLRTGMSLNTLQSFDRPAIGIHIRGSAYVNKDTVAYTTTYWWTDTLEIDYAETVINVRIWHTLSDECKVYVIGHELGHALGIQGHSDDPADVMYATDDRGCQYTVTAADAGMTAYQGGDRCAAEATPYGYVYVPAIEGHGVRLDAITEGVEYQITGDHPTGGHCSGVVDGDIVTLNRVVGLGVDYPDVRLRIDGDRLTVVP